jgi:hypothetical protein
MILVHAMSLSKWRLGATLALMGGLLSSLPPQPSREVWVTSNPPGAAAYFNGRPMGTTPCRIHIGARGRLRLEHPGYLPSEEFVRLNPESGLELSLTLRPGVAAEGPVRMTNYPPSLGKPPFTHFLPKTASLGQHAFALPPGWLHQSQSSSPGRFGLACGDGHSQPARQASLELLPNTDLPSHFRHLCQHKEQEGWVVRASQRGSESAWLRLERAQAEGPSRAAVVLQRQGSSVMQLNYQFDLCYDPFLYTRDLDFLRASLGFDW